MIATKAMSLNSNFFEGHSRYLQFGVNYRFVMAKLIIGHYSLNRKAYYQFLLRILRPIIWHSNNC